MKLEIALIRHGQTQGAAERLVGMTNEPLGEAGKRLILKKRESGTYPDAGIVFSSGLSRCYETAGIIYPNLPVVVLKDLRAIDYGDFEGRLMDELATDESFVKWADARGASACPNGEDSYAFQARSIAAFREIIDEIAWKGLTVGSIISHKMVIQEILQRYYVPRSNYTEWEIPHGGGYILCYDTIGSTAEILKRI